MQSESSEVNFSVDFVRTIAIVLVILVHVTAFPYHILGAPTPMEIVNWWSIDVYGGIAYVAVPLFVMLTGALLLDPAKADEPMGVFFKKRFKRIGIPMVFWSIIYLAWNTFERHQPLTVNGLLQGTVTGTYYHLWFLYLLVGLYLATPILRILIKGLDRGRFKFLLALWFAGNFLIPFINQFAPFGFNPVMFIFTGWVGYFLLGIFLLDVKVRSSVAALGVALGLLGTMIGAYFITASAGPQFTGYFDEPLNPTLILASTSLFLLLIAVPKSKIESHSSTLNRVLHWISQNTLPIYLFHIIIMETLQLGLLGFAINQAVLPPIVEIPLLTAVTFMLTCAVLYPLSKVPYVKKLVG